MSHELPTPSDPAEPVHLTRSANEELSAQIVAALEAAGLLTATSTGAATALLNSGSVRPGDWRALLEKQPLTATPDHAASHHST